MLLDAPDYSIAEIEWLARNEQVVHLADLVLRRTTLAITGRLSRRDLECMADVVAGAFGWSQPRREAELEATRNELSERHRLRC